MLWFTFLRYSLVFLLISSLTSLVSRIVLFNYHIIFQLSSCCWCLPSYQRSQKRYLIWFQFYFAKTCFVSSHMIYPGKCSMCTWEYSAAVGGDVLQMSVRSICSNVSNYGFKSNNGFKPIIPLLIFLSGCSIHGWKWDTEVPYYYWIVVYFSLHIC